jgi:hypothetical protein
MSRLSAARELPPSRQSQAENSDQSLSPSSVELGNAWKNSYSVKVVFVFNARTLRIFRFVCLVEATNVHFANRYDNGGRTQAE